MLPVPLRGAGLLDGTGAMTDNVRKPTTKRSIPADARHVEALHETLDRLRLKVAGLRASRSGLSSRPPMPTAA